MTVLWVGRALADLGGADPSHRAVLVEDGIITWTGDEPAAAPGRAEVRDLGEVWLTPGFVDAHVHATATGLERAGVRLDAVGSVAEALDVVRRHVVERDPAVVHGGGWDDQGWAERRPPTAGELTDAAGGRPVVLTRVDGHSCVVDEGVLAHLDLGAVADGVGRDDDGRATGWLREDAAAAALQQLWRTLPPADLARARDAAVAEAVGLGITSIHEMGVATLGTREDALAWAGGEWPIEVAVYWADLGWSPGEGLLPGGDLFLDGSIGSCTAATTEPYADNVGRSVAPPLFHDDEAVTAFMVRATRNGVGAGVHAIGDAATAQAVRAIRGAAEVCGVEAVRAARHRVEHVELITEPDVAALADLGVVASVQPAFDAAWNGPGGLYEHRFGRERADRSNPLAWFARAGARLCFSSDSTVTPMDPWGGVLAAQRHHGGLGVDRRTALHAATIGGHAAVRAEQRVGALVPGARADLVAWPFDPLTEPEPGGEPVAVLAGGALLKG